MAGLGPRDLEAMGAEFLVPPSGFDEKSSPVVKPRSSCKAEEILWDFVSMLETPSDDRPLAIDIGRLRDVETVNPGAG